MVTLVGGTRPESPFHPRDVTTKHGRAALRRALRELRPDPTDVDAVIAVSRAAARAQLDPFADEILAGAGDRLLGRGVRPHAPPVLRLSTARILLALGRGEVPGDWRAQVRRDLAGADDAGPDWSAELVADACDVAFHRTIQLDASSTPLVDDPDGFLEPFRASAAIRRSRAEFAAPGPYAHRFGGYDAVVVSEGNLNFVAGVDQRLADQGRTVQHVNLAALREDFPGAPHELVATVVAGRTREWDAATGLLLGNTGLVWAEWAQRQALIPSHSLPAGPRFVVRLHAVEVFTAMPQFVNWDRVDALVVVSPMMANAVNAILPVPPTVPVHVIPNDVAPAHTEWPKTPDARFTMALVGHNSQVKDPDWALDVLDLVRRSEPRARLLLVGDAMTPVHRAQGPGARGYAEAFLRRLAPYEAEGAVTVTGHVADVAEALQPAGFVLSTSRRESFHLGLVEGALSGCVAACRDWPIMAPFGGPATFLPQRWVVPDAAAMAQRILGFMGDPEAWAGEARRCRDEARALVRPAGDPLGDVLRG